MRAPTISRDIFATRAFVAAACALFVALACEESITAPGVCPDFCPEAFIEVRDTTLTSSVERDSAFSGYARAVDGFRMQVTGRDGDIESRGIVRFLTLPDSILIGSATRPIVSIDSYTVRVNLRRRDLATSGLEVLVHRIPGSIDTNTTFDDLTPYFEDSTIVGRITVDDTVALDSLFITLPPNAFPNLETDNFVTAIGLSVRGSTPTFASFGTTEGGFASVLTRYVQVDSANGELLAHADVRGANFDTFLREEAIVPAGDILVVGGTPASRSLLRLSIPPAILDSSEIVGAVLYLVPIAPSVGAPGDSFRVQVDALSADFGPKSPLVASGGGLDSASLLPGVLVAVGSMDTVALDITDIMRVWQADSSRPQSLMIRITPADEGAVLAQLFVGSSRSPGATPVVTITYVPPFRFEGE